MKYKIFAIFSGIFFVVFSIITYALFSTAPPVIDSSFFDAVSLTYVNDHYEYVVPAARVIFEPFIGFFGIFIQSTSGILTIVLTYLALRIFSWAYQRKHQTNNLNSILRFDIIDRWLSVFAAIFFTMVFIVLFVLIAFTMITASMLVIAWYGMTTLAWVIRISWVLLIGFSILYFLALTNKDAKIEASWSKFQDKYYSWRSKRRAYKIIRSKKNLPPLARETRRLFVFASLIGLIYLTSWFSVYIPKQIQTPLGPNEVLIDMHVHTTYSDGTISPHSRINWYIQHGISIAAISDHHGVQGAIECEKYVERFNKDFTVLIAQEYTMAEPRVHLNIYGLRENINPHNYTPEIPLESDAFDSLFLNVSDTIKYVKDKGGYVTVNHYSQIGKDDRELYSWENFRDWGVDGFELVNEDNIQFDITATEDSKNLTKFCKDNNLIMIGGSDTHEGADLTTVIKLRLDDINNKSLDAIFNALRRGDHEVVAIWKEYGEISPLSFLNPELFKYFAGLNMSQRISWVIWMLVLYLAGCGFYFVVYKKMNAKFASEPKAEPEESDS